MELTDLSLRQVLDQQPYDYLLDVAGNWGIDFRGTPPRKLLSEQIVKAMFNDERLRENIVVMPPQARDALAALCAVRATPRSAVEERFGRFGSTRSPSYSAPNRLTIAQGLHLLGFLLSVKQSPRGAEYVVMPTELAEVAQRCMQQLLDQIPTLSLIAEPQHVGDSSDHIVTQASHAMAYVLANGYPYTKAGTPHKGFVAKLRDHVYGKSTAAATLAANPDPEFLVSILVEAEVLADREEQTIELGAKAETFLAADREYQQAALFNGWWRLPHVVDLIDAPSNPYYFDPYWMDGQAAAVREAVCQCLKKLAVGAWVELGDSTLNSLVETVRTNPQIEHMVRYLSFGRESGQKALVKFNAAAARAIISDPFRWFGVVRTATESASGQEVRAFALTELGEWLLGFGPRPSLHAHAAFALIQPSFDVMLPPSASVRTILDVESFSSLTHRDVASTYRITKDSITHAMERGQSLETIRRSLEAASGQPLPQNVARSIEDWVGSFGRVKIFQGPIVVADSSALLTELMSSKRLKGLIGSRVSDRMAQVVDRQGIALVRKLRELGYQPQADPSLDDASRRQSVDASASSARSQFTKDELRSIYAAAELSLFVSSFGVGVNVNELEAVQQKIYASSSPSERRMLDNLEQAMAMLAQDLGLDDDEEVFEDADVDLGDEAFGVHGEGDLLVFPPMVDVTHDGDESQALNAPSSDDVATGGPVPREAETPIPEAPTALSRRAHSRGKHPTHKQ